jgi:hypothetical protein
MERVTTKFGTKGGKNIRRKENRTFAEDGKILDRKTTKY